MSSTADDLIRAGERGDRVRKVRESLKLTQEQFIAALEEAAEGFGYAIDLDDDSKLSRLEKGTRKLTAEEAVLISRLDREKRPIEWLVFGDKRAAKRVTAKPRAATTTAAARGRTASNG